ncbi:MAG: dienelactone hydrolase family protein [Bacteroidota bacterium]
MPPGIETFEKSTYPATVPQGYEIKHDVYTKGEGPVCVIIQELPGISEATLAMAERFRVRGFRVVLPHLFGPLGRKATLGNTVRIFCMRKELYLFARNRRSPIVDWLAALCEDLKQTYQVPGVAVIGMCLTGNFAVSLMADEAVLAGFASQPSGFPLDSGKKLPFSPEELAAIKQKLDQHGPMHAGRFCDDILCKDARLKSLENALNKDGVRIKTHRLKGRKHGLLTGHYDDTPGSETQLLEAEIMAYFKANLTP